jgi:hypothetical protein
MNRTAERCIVFFFVFNIALAYNRVGDYSYGV